MPELKNRNKSEDFLDGTPRYEIPFEKKEIEGASDTSDPLQEDSEEEQTFDQNRFTEFSPNQERTDYNPTLQEERTEEDEEQEEGDYKNSEKDGSSNLDNLQKTKEIQQRLEDFEKAKELKKAAELGKVAREASLIARVVLFFASPIGWIVGLIILLLVAITTLLLFVYVIYGGDPKPRNIEGETPPEAAKCSGTTDNGFYSTSEAIKLFGNPDSGGVQSQLVTVDFMGKKVQFHKQAAGCLKAVAAEIKKTKPDYKIELIGTFANRSKRGGRTKSMHSFGIAMDINWDKNPFCYCNNHDMPPEWVAAFKKYGFNWGGDWKRKKDWMHFEWHGLKPN